MKFTGALVGLTVVVAGVVMGRAGAALVARTLDPAVVQRSDAPGMNASRSHPHSATRNPQSSGFPEHLGRINSRRAAGGQPGGQRAYERECRCGAGERQRIPRLEAV